MCEPRSSRSSSYSRLSSASTSLLLLPLPRCWARTDLPSFLEGKILPNLAVVFDWVRLDGHSGSLTQGRDKHWRDMVCCGLPCGENLGEICRDLVLHSLTSSQLSPFSSPSFCTSFSLSLPSFPVSCVICFLVQDPLKYVQRGYSDHALEAIIWYGCFRLHCDTPSPRLCVFQWWSAYSIRLFASS